MFNLITPTMVSHRTLDFHGVTDWVTQYGKYERKIISWLKIFNFHGAEFHILAFWAYLGVNVCPDSGCGLFIADSTRMQIYSE